MTPYYQDDAVTIYHGVDYCAHRDIFFSWDNEKATSKPLNTLQSEYAEDQRIITGKAMIFRFVVEEIAHYDSIRRLDLAFLAEKRKPKGTT